MRAVALLGVIAVLLASTIVSAAVSPSGRTPALRDAEGYAIASCFFGQKQPYLKDQGDGWASAIIQRGSGDLDALGAISAAVKQELAKRDMAVIRTDAGADKAIPVLYCGEIIDRPRVRAAINLALTKLRRPIRPH